MLRKLLMAVVSAAALLIAACGDAPRTMTTQASSLTPQVVYVPAPRPSETRVKLVADRLVAGINDSYRAIMVLDSGATVCLISPALALKLIDEGTITNQDVIGKSGVRLAGGSVAYGWRINLRSVEVGGVRITNVEAMVMRDVPVYGMLLGQSFLRRLPRWSIDNSTSELVIGG